MLSKWLLISSTLFVCVNTCKIHLKVRSATKKPFQIEILMPSMGVQTERVQFDEDRKEKKVMITGKNCSGKHWTFRTFKNENGNWVKAQEHTGRFDGQGEIIVQVGHDYLPRIVSRAGVACSETLICG